jgi:F0F1-type ATP synthase assembly protein I
MRNNSWNPKEFSQFMSIGQVGMEMAVPIGIGVALDHYLHWMPWATIAGAILGFVGGMTHLITLANRRDGDSSKPRGESP